MSTIVAAPSTSSSQSRFTKRIRVEPNIPVLPPIDLVTRKRLHKKHLKNLSSDNYEDGEEIKGNNKKNNSTVELVEDEYVDTKSKTQRKKVTKPGNTNSVVAAVKSNVAKGPQVNYSETAKRSAKLNTPSIPTNALASSGSGFSVEASHKARKSLEEILLNEFPQYRKQLLNIEDEEEDENNNNSNNEINEQEEENKMNIDSGNKTQTSNNSLMNREPLNYFTVIAAPSVYPSRSFCSVCGFMSKYICTRCGMKYCSMKCESTHKDTRCLKFTE